MIAVDTSVVVPASVSWHEGHRAAVEQLKRKPRLPAHVALETFSVITRLPTPHRVRPDVAAQFLRSRFPGPFLTLSPRGHLDLLREVALAGLAGGAVYDALIAATAREAGATLVSRDRRAATIYELMGTKFELLL